jgi:D-tyrosyl-tRNA(Tyr) deacylase
MSIEIEIRSDLMRVVIQRVLKASVTVENKICGEIGRGLLVLLGVEDMDSEEDVVYLAEKISNLRIFEDENDKMNLSLLDVNGDMLVVSQFTLHGDCRKGRRPNFMKAANAELAEKLYLKFIDECKKYVSKIEKGKFQAHMEVTLTNDGPVTILLDSKKIF